MNLVTSSQKRYLDSNLNTNTNTIKVDTITAVTPGGVVSINGKAVNNVTTATATSDGLTTGLLSSYEQFVTVTSSSANNIVTLPAVSTVSIGTVIRGAVGSNGFKLQVAVADAATVKLNNVTTSVKAAIPANVSFRVELISATQWILTTLTALGAVGTAIVPA